MIGIKRCSICKKEKPLNEFYARKSAKDGRQSECKECNNNRHKKYYQEHIEEYRETHAKYHLENYEKIRARATEYANSERGKAIRKKYYEEHKEEIKKYHRQYRKKNIERIRECQKRYYHNNKDKAAI